MRRTVLSHCSISDEIRTTDDQSLEIFVIVVINLKILYDRSFNFLIEQAHDFSHDFYVSYHQSKISWSYARNYDGEC